MIPVIPSLPCALQCCIPETQTTSRREQLWSTRAAEPLCLFVRSMRLLTCCTCCKPRILRIYCTHRIGPMAAATRGCNHCNAAKCPVIEAQCDRAHYGMHPCQPTAAVPDKRGVTARLSSLLCHKQPCMANTRENQTSMRTDGCPQPCNQNVGPDAGGINLAGPWRPSTNDAVQTA